MQEREAEQLVMDYNESLDHLWMGNGQSIGNRQETYHREYERLLGKLTGSIQVWPWDDAPLEFKSLSPHGGDEDWVAFIPAKFAGMFIQWMDSGSSFGCCDVSEHPFPDGSMVRIGAHA